MELSDWTILRVEDGNDLVLARLRTKIFPGLGDKKLFKIDVLIKWEYSSEENGGMPTSAEKSRMDDFERLLDDLTEANGNSLLVLVATGMGLREWHFYVRSRDEFVAEMNKALQGRPRFPVEIEFYDDPEWQNWNDFMELHGRSSG